MCSEKESQGFKIEIVIICTHTLFKLIYMNVIFKSISYVFTV